MSYIIERERETVLNIITLAKVSCTGMRLENGKKINAIHLVKMIHIKDASPPPQLGILLNISRTVLH